MQSQWNLIFLREGVAIPACEEIIRYLFSFFCCCCFFVFNTTMLVGLVLIHGLLLLDFLSNYMQIDG